MDKEINKIITAIERVIRASYENSETITDTTSHLEYKNNEILKAHRVVLEEIRDGLKDISKMLKY